MSQLYQIRGRSSLILLKYVIYWSRMALVFLKKIYHPKQQVQVPINTRLLNPHAVNLEIGPIFIAMYP